MEKLLEICTCDDHCDSPCPRQIQVEDNARLLHEWESTRGLWCIDRDPREVDYEWICRNAAMLKDDTPRPKQSEPVKVEEQPQAFGGMYHCGLCARVTKHVDGACQVCSQQEHPMSNEPTNKDVPLNYKQDDREPRGMWCNGDYCCKCCKCKEHFCGDKRSTECADCAYKEQDQPVPIAIAPAGAQFFRESCGCKKGACRCSPQPHDVDRIQRGAESGSAATDAKAKERE